MDNKTIRNPFTNPQKVSRLKALHAVEKSGNIVNDNSRSEFSQSQVGSAKSDSVTAEFPSPLQAQRYRRHVIIPEIGELGQKKLLNTKVLIAAPDPTACDFLLRYLTAIGVSHIYCFFKNTDGYTTLFEALKDFNPDVTCHLPDDFLPDMDFNIIVGRACFSLTTANLLLNSTHGGPLAPTLIAVSESWQGYFCFCQNKGAIQTFLNLLVEKNVPAQSPPPSDNTGLLLSDCFLGTLLSIEIVKARLNLGTLQEECFYFDLLNNRFDHRFKQGSLAFTPLSLPLEESERALALSKTKVLTIGSGGLGSPVNLILAKIGIKHLTLLDHDTIELSNLNRQILHTTSRIDNLKVESAKQTLEAINTNLNVRTISDEFSPENAREIVREHDLIIDCVDNFPTRYLLNDICYFEDKPLIEAGVLGFYGQITTIIPNAGPCFRCLFPKPEDQKNTVSPEKAEKGVLGPLPGVLGVLEAVEAIKFILKQSPDLCGKLLTTDTLTQNFNLFTAQKCEDCLLCG